jgi:DNA excision repair protein ERCC-2
VPFFNLMQRNSKARMQFIEAEYKIANQEFLMVEAMRQTAQCVGGVLHSKEDYGLLIFADKRYKSADLTDKLPQWIKSKIEL